MAIIRKGDRVAEAKLKARAKEQGELKNNKTTLFTKKDPKNINVSKDKTGKVTATRTTRSGKVRRVTGPITGKQTGERRDFEKKGGNLLKGMKKLSGTGIIQSGSLVKGGNEALGEKLEFKKRNK